MRAPGDVVARLGGDEFVLILNMDVVAESVENAERREVLQTLGCEFAHGYLLSEPVDAAKAEWMLVADRTLEGATAR